MSEQRTSDGRFAIGEIAIYVRKDSPNYGREVIITGPLVTRCKRDAWTGEWETSPGYTFQIPSDWVRSPISKAGIGYVRPEHLRKRRPPREDLQVVRWDQCPWQPEKVYG